MHLSGPAHQLIGQEAARLVRANTTINLDAREKAMKEYDAEHIDEEKAKPPGFNLKFPPGY